MILCGKGSELFRSLTTCGARTASEVRISPKTEIVFPCTIFFHAFAIIDQCLVVLGIRQALLGISILPHAALCGFPFKRPLDGKKVAFQRFNCYRKLNFQGRRDKNSILFSNVLTKLTVLSSYEQKQYV